MCSCRKTKKNLHKKILVEKEKICLNVKAYVNHGERDIAKKKNEEKSEIKNNYLLINYCQ